MRKFILRRILAAIVVIFIVSFIVFVLSRASGDPRTVFMSEHSTKEMWDAWGKEMGLDKPFLMQYVIWAGKAVRGDFGKSLFEERSASKAIRERISATLQLSAGAFFFTIMVGVPLGVLSAVKRGTVWDYTGRTFALFGQALPPFWLGIMLIMIFAVWLELLPTSRQGGLDHFILPSITLGWLTSAALLRLVRSAMLNVIDSEYVKLARAKGVSNNRIIWKHAFRNAMVVPLTYAGLLLAAFITGTVVTETVFAWPGLGRLAVSSVLNLDFPVLSGVVLLYSGIYIFANLVVDISYALIDPRIRYS